MADSSIAAAQGGSWTAEELMHGKAGDADAASAVTPGATCTTGKSTSRYSTRKLKGKSAIDPMDWGLPGHLTEEEVSVFVSSLIFRGFSEWDRLLFDYGTTCADATKHECNSA